MYLLSPVTGTSELVAVVTASTAFTLVMNTNEFYMFMSTTTCFIKQSNGATAATAATGSMMVPANIPVRISGNNGSRLTVIRDAADGKASLTPAQI